MSRSSASISTRRARPCYPPALNEPDIQILILEQLRQLCADVDALAAEMAAVGAVLARVETEIAEMRQERAAAAHAGR